MLLQVKCFKHGCGRGEFSRKLEAVKGYRYLSGKRIPPIYSKMNYVAYHHLKIFKCSKFFTFGSIDFLKIIFKYGFAHFFFVCGAILVLHTQGTLYVHQHKQSFQFQHFNFFHRDNIFLKSKQREHHNVSQTKFNVVWL